MPAASRRSSTRNSCMSARSSAFNSSNDMPRQCSSDGRASVGRAGSKSVGSDVSSGNPRDPRASSVAFRPYTNSNSTNGAQERPRAKSSTKNASSTVRGTSTTGSCHNTPRKGSNGRPRGGSSDGRRSRRSGGHPERISEEELLSLILRGTYLADMRPDMYRLDLSRKDDLRLLYEAQHRVDPELVRFRKHISPQTWKKMHESHIFDVPPPPPTPPPSSKVKDADGLGSLARFILSAETPTTSPVRGRKHRSNSSGEKGLWLFGCRKDDRYMSPPSSSRNTGRCLSTRPPDKLGRDLMSQDPLSAEIMPRHGVRTMKAVQAFERLQPKLMLPPKKQTSRITDAMRAHSAGSDNDIFGVRERRERMMQGVRSRSSSASAAISFSPQSNEPYGLDVDDEALHREAPYLGPEDPGEIHGGPRRRSSLPYGEEKPYEKPISTHHRPSHYRRHGSSNSSNNGSFASRSNSFASRSRASPARPSSRPYYAASPAAPAAASPANSRNRSGSPLGGDSGRVCRWKGAAPWQNTSVDDVTLGSAASIIFDEAQSGAPSGKVSPRLRTGRARVPGYSFTTSKIVFGAAEVMPSPRLSPRTQLDSAQMRGILRWT